MREHLYRTAGFPRLQAAPHWLVEEIEAGYEDAADDNSARDRSAYLLARAEILRAAAEPARQLLEMGDDLPATPVKRTAAMAEAAPDRAAELWQALWTVVDAALAQRAHAHSLQALARAMESRALYTDAGWPETWAMPHCDLWARCGGSPATARAWERAGWAADEALLASIPVRRRSMTVEQRVLCVTPPAKAQFTMDTAQPAAFRTDRLTTTKAGGR